MKTALEHIGIVFNKEFSDNLRDRRSLFSALISTIIGPLVVLLMVIVVGKAIFIEPDKKLIELPVIGAENAPTLLQFLGQNGIEIVAGPVDPENEIRNGNLEIVLIIPKEYTEEFNSGRPATIQVVIDSSRQSSIRTIETVRSLLESYNNQIGSLRLLARGISPIVTKPVTIENVDVATPQTQALIFLNMMPYFIILVVFVGGMHVIIDATAGERERGSLEPLLINPLPRWEMVVGKLTAAIPFAIFAVFINLVAFAVAFNLFPIEDYVGIQLTVNISAFAGIFLISLPMILLASALQMVIATFARSFKEAQTYTGFLPLIPALPGIGLAFLPVKANLWLMLIPTFGQQLIINQMMRGEPLNAMYITISIVTTLVVAIILTLVAIKLYERERIIFGAR
jgi:sodium transport system permease protein